VCAGTSGQCGDGTLQGSCNEACDDGNTTPGDGCDASCQFEPCAPTPVSGCRAPVVSAKAQLKIKRGTVDTKDQLQWKWSRGAATTVAEFRDPTTSESYYLCVYDKGQLVSSTTMPAAGTCAGKACWKASSTGYQYKDKELTPDGGAQLKMKAGLDEKAQAQFKGRGANLETPALPLTGPVRVQLKQTSGTVCWEATYSSPFVKNDGLSGSFLDKAD
jgi:cysteine-rich repeat protein